MIYRQKHWIKKWTNMRKHTKHNRMQGRKLFQRQDNCVQHQIPF